MRPNSTSPIHIAFLRGYHNIKILSKSITHCTVLRFENRILNYLNNRHRNPIAIRYSVYCMSNTVPVSERTLFRSNCLPGKQDLTGFSWSYFIAERVRICSNRYKFSLLSNKQHLTIYFIQRGEILRNYRKCKMGAKTAKYKLNRMIPVKETLTTTIVNKEKNIFKQNNR